MSEPTVDTADANPTWEADGYVVHDRSGYNLEFVDGVSPYYVITREDGIGIGAYGSDQAADEAIAKDREWLASQPVEDAAAPEANVTQPAQAEEPRKTTQSKLGQTLRLDR